MVKGCLYALVPLPRFPIARILKSKGISMRQAAGMCGLDRTMLQDWKTGKSFPSWRGLLMFCKALEVNLGDIDPSAKKGRRKRATTI